MQADKIFKLMQDAAQDAESYIAAELPDKEFPSTSVRYNKIA